MVQQLDDDGDSFTPTLETSSAEAMALLLGEFHELMDKWCERGYTVVVVATSYDPLEQNASMDWAMRGDFYAAKGAIHTLVEGDL